MADTSFLPDKNDPSGTSNTNESSENEKTTDPIREQLIQARRDQILDAAATVFAQKGFHRATTKEIARIAGISEGTIYNYFSSKSDLVVGLMVRLSKLDSLDGELIAAMQGDVRDFFVVIFRHRARLLAQNEGTLQAILPEVLTHPDLREQFYQQYVRRIAVIIEQYVHARIAAGHIRPIHVPLTVRAIQGMFVGLLILRLLGDETLQSDWDELPETLAMLIFDGLRSSSEEAPR